MGDPTVHRRLTAILAADVVTYSRLMSLDEAGTHAAFKAHRSAMFPAILNHGGRIVKNTGDGFLLEFPSVVGAIEAAVEMQQLMAERNAHLPADRVMRFRMGIHMGDVIDDEGEVFGDDVNIAVRLEAVAPPGGIAVSEKAYLQAGRHVGAALVNAARTRRTGRKATVTLPGGDLVIEWRDDDHVMLTGPAEFEFSGAFDPRTGAWTRDKVDA